MSDGTSVARPAPLVGEGVSMAGNDWFPLEFDRLRKSKWWRRASDTARARNIMLWGEAYKQVPAGSMPDDDDELAEAAGFGMDVDAFLAFKDEIMAPWVLCSDGRWYHPTVCEKVIEAWDRASDRRKRDAEKKRAAREKARGHLAKSGAVPPETANVPCEIADVPRDMAEKGGDIGTQYRQDSISPQPPRGGVSDEEFSAIWEAYPASGRETCPATKARAEVDAAAAAGHGVAEMLDGAKRAASHVAGGGRAKRIDRWARERLFAKPYPPRLAAKSWDGPPDLWDAVARAKGDGWATSYLGSCHWTGSGLRTASPTVRKALEAEVGAILRDHGAKIEMQQVSA